MNRNSSYITLFLVLVGSFAFGQANINRMEYFIDTDPGIGNGTAVAITTDTNVTESFTLPTSALPVGFHTVYFRVQDENSEWSISESRSFYISQQNLVTQADVQAMEYFIDTDPGIGAGMPLTITASTNILVNQTIPTSALPAGFHVLYVRSRDSDGVWGNVESRSFYVSQSDIITQANIVSIEYYFDTDPGVGSGTAIPITPATSLNSSVTISTAALPAGHHTLYLRALDSDGVWGEIESRPFYIDALGNGRITGIEYFYNTDPGIGNATDITFGAPVDSVDTTINLSTASLSPGPQVVGIRLVGETGFFSITEFANITLCDGAIPAIEADTVCLGSPTTLLDMSTNVLAGDIFSWDFDGDGSEDDNTPGNKTFVYPAPGLYRAVLTIDRVGCIGSDTIDVVVEDIPVANAGLDQSSCTTSAVLAATPVVVGQTGIWTIASGTGTLDDPNSPVANLSGVTSNSVELVWTVSTASGSCDDDDTVTITVNQPITALREIGSVDIGQSINSNVQSSAIINTGDILTTEILIDPMYGLASLQNDGSIDYTPDLDAPTLDSLQFRLTNQCSNLSDNYLVFDIINDPPVVDNANSNPILSTTDATLDLTTIISDPNNNLDFSTIQIVSQPISNAPASVDINGILTIDYAGITFSGTDSLEIRVCDLVGVCTTQLITIPGVDVGGENPPIKVFNGVSPDGDGYNDFLEIENIEFYPDNTVLIVNRWGTKIEELKGYNNVDVVFNDPNLPSGTYYYHIVTGIENSDPITGHFILKTNN